MSRYKIQIETGLLGVALCLTIFFWSNGRAFNLTSASQSNRSFCLCVASVDEILSEMNQELKTAEHLLITEPDHLAFLTDDGVRKSYRFVNRSLWKNQMPLIHEISTFHFEYRNRYGQLLSRATRDRDQIYRIQYVMHLPSRDFTKTCIKLSSANHQRENVQLAMAEIH